MTARYLLDTNILSDLVRNPQGWIAEQIGVVGEAAVATSVIVAAELRYGAAKKGSSRLLTQIEAILGVMDVVAFDTPMDNTYGKLRAELEIAGTPTGANNLLKIDTALFSTLQIPTRPCPKLQKTLVSANPTLPGS